jgi:cytochrome c553
MRIRTRDILVATSLLVIISMALAACGGTASEPTEAPAEEEHMEEHAEDEHVDEHAEDEHMDEHDMEGMHDVPEDAAAVPNPIESDEVSEAAGAQVFAVNCATCHGDSGEGDGPAAAGLDPAPSNLHEDHVQGLTDGALFYIITNGVADTAMPAWGESLSETDRWNVVNFLRTFQDG